MASYGHQPGSLHDPSTRRFPNTRYFFIQHRLDQDLPSLFVPDRTGSIPRLSTTLNAVFFPFGWKFFDNLTIGLE